MSKYCENCGCSLRYGICTNCLEELYIHDYQSEYISDPLSNDFLEKIGQQRKELKERKRVSDE